MLERIKKDWFQVSGFLKLFRWSGPTLFTAFIKNWIRCAITTKGTSSVNKKIKHTGSQKRYYIILSLCWGSEHSPVFRQSSELCLKWLHDIPHILHQVHGRPLALTLTFLSSNALALTPPWLSFLVPGTNFLPKLRSSPSHSCIMLQLSLLIPLSSLVSSCLILPILCPCYPSLPTMPSLSRLSSPCSSLLLFPLLWRSGMMWSQRARPCLITLIKHPVR